MHETPLQFPPSLVYPVRKIPSIRSDVLEKLAADGFHIKDEFHVTFGGSEYRAGLAEADSKALLEITEEVLPVTFDGPLYKISKPKVTAHGTFRTGSCCHACERRRAYGPRRTSV
jgi:hypothetical protein